MMRFCVGGFGISLVAMVLFAIANHAVDSWRRATFDAFSPYGFAEPGSDPFASSLYSGGDSLRYERDFDGIESAQSVIDMGGMTGAFAMTGFALLAALTLLKRLLTGLYWFYRGIRSGGRPVTPPPNISVGPGRIGAGETPPSFSGEGWHPGYPPQELHFGPAGTGWPPEPGP